MEIFSDNTTPKDSNIMVGLGKAGLGVAGVAGLGAGVEIGRSAYHGVKLGKDLGEIKKLKDNKAVRSTVKEHLQRYGGDSLVNKARTIEKNLPKFSKIDKAQKALNWWGKSSNLSRTVLNNLEHYSQMGVDRINKEKLGKEGTQLVNKIPSAMRRVGKMGTALKNAKALGKVAGAAGTVGGFLYLNGRTLQTGGNRPVK